MKEFLKCTDIGKTLFEVQEALPFGGSPKLTTYQLINSQGPLGKVLVVRGVPQADCSKTYRLT